MTTTYLVSGTKQDGSDFDFCVLANQVDMNKCLHEEEGTLSYLQLQTQLVNQGLMDTASKITRVDRALSQFNIPTIKFNTKSVTEPVVQSPLVVKSGEPTSEVIKPEVVANGAKIEHAVKPVSKSCGRVVANAACYTIVALSGIALACVAGDHYMNYGDLRIRLFEQLRLLALNEMTAQEMKDRLCLAFQQS